MRGFIVAYLAFMLFAVACSGRGRSSHPAPLSIPCTNDATQQAAIAANVANLTLSPLDTRIAEEGRTTPLPFVFADDEVTCRIRKVLLNASDLGSDWRLSDFNPPDGIGSQIFGGGPGTCGVPLTNLTAGVQRMFQKGALPTPSDRAPATFPPLPGVLDEQVLVFRPDTARDYIEAMNRSCGIGTARAATAAASTPEPGHHSVAVQIPAIGDQSVTFSEPVDSSEPQLEVLVRRGDVVEDLVLVGVVAAPGALTTIVREADAKIAAQGNYLEPTSVAGSADASPTLDSTSRQAILNSALPAEDQLPADWVPGHRATDYDTDALQFCADSPQLPRRDRGASASYDGSGFGFSQATIALGIGVMSYAPADADAIMRAVGDGSAFPDGCAGMVQDIAVSWGLTRLDVAGLGDSTTAWRAVAAHTADAGAPDVRLVSDIELDFVVFRRGNLIALVIESHAAPGTDDPFSTDVPDAIATLTTFGKLVDAKLKTIESKVPPG